MGRASFTATLMIVSIIFTLVDDDVVSCLHISDVPNISHRTTMVLPLFPPKDTSSGRLLQKIPVNARMALHDDLLLNGYYTTRLWIGTPPQRFALIVDTGSTVTYVPCSTCEQCGKHQVRLMNLSTKGNDSLVKWAIYPAGSANYMTKAAATEIIHRLAENRVRLPDTFGSYKLFEWGVEPPPKRTGWPQSYLIVVIALSVVLILGLSAFLGCLIWRRGQESPLPYERVESVETVVREQELQPLK